MNESKRGTRSDLKTLDAHEITPEEYEEIPELTEADFARGTWQIGGKPLRRGRPKVAAPKQAINIRLSPEVLAHFRSTGPGWQSRINEVLKAHIAKRR
jgi:uncharacterized protein (DUF4415 family)